MSRDRFDGLHRQNGAGPEHIRLISEGGALSRSPRPLCIDSIQVTQTCTTESQHTAYRSTAPRTIFSVPDNSLFSIPSEHAEELDGGSLPGVLRTRFEQQRTALSDTTALIVQIPGRIWLLLDQGNRYFIRKVAHQLTVFRAQ